MDASHCIGRVVIASASALFGISCFAQPSVLQTLKSPSVSSYQLDSVESKLKTQMQISIDESRRLLQSLDEVRANTATLNPTTAASVITAREAQLQESQKSIAVAETAIQLVRGNESNLPRADLERILPDVLESISEVANPMLPTCGKDLSYRGDAASINWLSTLDDFLDKHGSLLGGVGRIDVETSIDVPAVGGTKKVINRIPVGTGFAVSQRRIVTAGHVAEMFWDRTKGEFKRGVMAVYFTNGGEHKHGCATADSGASTWKLGSVGRIQFERLKPLSESPLDFAVVNLKDGEENLPVSLPLIEKDGPRPSAFVVIVQYPNAGGPEKKERWRAAMNVPTAAGMFPVVAIKRIAPGMVLLPCDNGTIAHIPHDVTTLNQGSGAPIIDVDTGRVVAIQISGYQNIGDGKKYCNLGLRSNAPDVSLLQ